MVNASLRRTNHDATLGGVYQKQFELSTPNIAGALNYLARDKVVT